MSLDHVYEDAFNLLCGERLGTGTSREVFACKLFPHLVVKVDYEPTNSFSNVFECNFWDHYRHIPEVEKWLAPCHFLSPDGRILLQSRVKPVSDDYTLPSRIPKFITDRKLDNFGLLDGRLVCVDYAMVVMNPETKLTKVNWNIYE